MHHVRISPASPGEWCVGVGAGHYNNPLRKDEAIEQAMRIAATEHLAEIGIYDDHGNLLETRTVTSLTSRNVPEGRKEGI